MLRVVPAAKKLAVGLAAVTVLSFGVGGVAGAATSAPSPTGSALAKFNCGHATRALARIHKVESRIAAGLPKLTAAEHKAKAAGHTTVADRIQRRITRLESGKTKARLARLSQAIEAKCGVSEPAGSSSGAASTQSSATA